MCMHVGIELGLKQEVSTTHSTRVLCNWLPADVMYTTEVCTDAHQVLELLLTDVAHLVARLRIDVTILILRVNDL